MITEKEAEQKLKELEKATNKMFLKLSKNIDTNNDTIAALLLYLDTLPLMFAEQYGMLNRDMLKWTLRQHIGKFEDLIAKIEQIEKEHNLPMHGIDDCQ